MALEVKFCGFNFSIFQIQSDCDNVTPLASGIFTKIPLIKKSVAPTGYEAGFHLNHLAT